MIWTSDMDEAIAADEGLSAIEADFYTEHFVVRGRIISPELRLSDHLNSSTSTLELQPLQVHRVHGGAGINITGSASYIHKAHLLFVLPLSEPVAGSDPTVRLRTISQRCWAGIGRYNLLGNLHMEAGRNPRLFVRSLEERQFLPLTNVEIGLPDGTTRTFPTVVVNRNHLELLALQPGETS